MGIKVKRTAEAGQDCIVWMGKSFALAEGLEGRDTRELVQVSEAGGQESEIKGQRSVSGQAKLPERLVQFIKFCLVGGSGVFVDMGILYLLADPKCLGLNITVSKVIAAEAAMLNNFVWNELWTFRRSAASPSPCLPGSPVRIARRFLTFNAICGIGIGLAVLLLHLFHFGLGWNLYLSNLLAVLLVTLWNFGLNARFNWQIRPN
jgi:dolichol-phosphate mannosyltransferase